MPDTFLKLRLWAKLLVFLVVGAWAVLFLWFNADGQPDVSVWLLPFVAPARGSPVLLMLAAFLVGGALALAGRALLMSGGQVRRLRAGSRDRRESDALRREIDAMKQATHRDPGGKTPGKTPGD